MSPLSPALLAVLALSLTNAILLFWLGWMVLLNAERRSWAVWLVAAALITGGQFFSAHALAAVPGGARLARAIVNGWSLGWLPGVALPFVWYVAMLWHAGYWEKGDPGLHHRHRRRLPLTAAVGCGILGSLLLLWIPWLPYPARRVPLLMLACPLFALCCIGLSLDVLRRPGPSSRVMGAFARARARPWLIAVSLALLAISVAAGGMMLWLAGGRGRGIRVSPEATLGVLTGLDLAVTALVLLSVLLLGQAIVAYEIFTGNTLPRRGLRRQWHAAAALAGAYGGAAALSVALKVPGFFALLLIAVLMPLLYALAGWRSHVERERGMARLRPFVSGPRLYDALIGPDAATDPPLAPFQSLCAEVLGARAGYLVAVGPFAPLVGPALAHPAGAPPPESVAEVAARCADPGLLCLSLAPEEHGGVAWGVPLRHGRQLVGLLLLSEKREGGLYTEEEMDTARAAGERLLDVQAGTALARRLMALQRRRIAETGVVDRRSRRVLHDDVLPQVHAAVLMLSASAGEGAAEALALLGDAHRRISDLLRELPAGAPELREGVVPALRRVADEELAGSFDAVAWEMDPEAERRLSGLPPVVAEALFGAAREALRNAARHARGGDSGRPLRLRIAITAREGPEVVIEDDGVGHQGAGASGGGSGQGLALHGTLMAVVGGSLSLQPRTGGGTRVVLSLPDAAGSVGADAV